MLIDFSIVVDEEDNLDEEFVLIFFKEYISFIVVIVILGEIEFIVLVRNDYVCLEE